jgi:uncharacterized membrane protein
MEKITFKTVLGIIIVLIGVLLIALR